MKENSRREIRNRVEEAFNKTIDDLKIVQPSKSTRKLIMKAAKRISKELKNDLKQAPDKIFQ